MKEYKYSHLMSPVKVGSLVLKNHMIASCCLPHFLQGPETYPSEATITFVENLAKAGAAIVTIPDRFDSTRQFPMDDIKRAPCWDMKDPSVDNYMAQMIEAVHFQGSYITVQISKFHSIPRDVGVYAHYEEARPAMKEERGRAPEPVYLKEISKEQMQQLKEEIVSRCVYCRRVGFDGVVLHGAYSYNIFAKFLPSSTNLRTDEYGGPIENRARFLLEVVESIREQCGRDFYIELQMSGDCMTEEELVRFAKLCEGKIDLLQLRLMDMDASHVTPYNYDGVSVPKAAHYAEVIRSSGAKIAVAPCGGFHSPDMNEKLIAEGKTDLIAMARPFLCDPEYGKKIEEDRVEDIVPCLYCNKCHDHIRGEWASACRVNPMMGIAHRADKMLDTGSGKHKKVAVIGGGPAGMRAALFAAEKGHQITLYEKSDQLGGQLRHADYPEFKWALKQYKDYLIAQIGKNPSIRVLLNTPAVPAEIEAQNYDAVITALGARPRLPDIPGVKESKVWMPMEVYGHEQELGKEIVLVGGSETGVETAMYLAECGHQVTVLTRNHFLAQNGRSVHAYALMMRRWKSEPGFRGITDATTTRISDHSVTYRDNTGEHTLDCDDVVVSGGVQAEQEEALRFAGLSRQYFNIGDSSRPGNLQTCNRSALAAAAKL